MIKGGANKKKNIGDRNRNKDKKNNKGRDSFKMRSLEHLINKSRESCNWIKKEFKKRDEGSNRREDSYSREGNSKRGAGSNSREEE